MNRRDFLKSTAALATVAVAGKASIEPVSPPALLCPVDVGFGRATWRLAKTGNCFDRPEATLRHVREYDGHFSRRLDPELMARFNETCRKAHEAFEREVQREAKRLMKSPYFADGDRVMLPRHNWSERSSPSIWRRSE